MAGKRTGAAAMLAAGRRREGDTSTRDPGAESPRTPVVEVPRDLGNESPSDRGASATREQVAQGTSAPVAYQRTAVYLTPELRRWLRDTARSLPDGLSASDVVRLALERLRGDAEGERLDLVPELVRRAHQEAERYAGRRNRGLPARDGAGE